MQLSDLRAARSAGPTLSMPTLRQKLASRLLHLYPLYSGCGSLANQAWLERLVGSSAELAWARVSGGQLLCPLDDYAGRAAYYVGDLDRKITWLCKRIVEPGDTVLDVGANLGLVTVLLSSLVGPSGRVLAFEPNPEIADLCERSLARNACQNVELLRCALGSAGGVQTLVVREGNAGTASLVDAGAGVVAKRFEIPVRRLAPVVEERAIKKIRLMKLGVEGFEPEVLRGAHSVLESIRPEAIVFEMNDRHVAPLDHPTFQLLRAADYGFFEIPKCLLRMQLKPFDPESQRPASHDFLATPLGGCYEKTAQALAAAA